MTFATKKEADAYDKMLDIADNLFEFLDNSKLKLSENQMEAISLLLAESRDDLVPILRGIKPKKTQPAAKTPAAKPAALKTAAASKSTEGETAEDNPPPKRARAKK